MSQFSCKGNSSHVRSVYKKGVLVNFSPLVVQDKSKNHSNHQASVNLNFYANAHSTNIPQMLYKACEQMGISQ